MYAMLDTNGTHDMIGHLVFVTDCLITVYLCFACYFQSYSVCIIFICSHVICTCTFPFILTHSLGRFL